MRILAKVVKISCFGTLQIIQRPATIRGMFIQEIQLNLDKNSELCGNLICPSPWLCGSLKNQLPHKHNENQNPRSH